jgi:tetratricopeptide (TPR) repeat protein
MNYLGSAVLLAWLPFVVLVFTTLPPKRAVANLFVAAWLFLPPSGFALPGMPDYTKMTATVIGVLLCSILFDSGRLLSVRFHWFDLPMLIWCLGTFLTAMANDLGAYEGSSALLETTVLWGLPYLIGRVYLDDLDALKDLTRAIVIGGLCYIPFCLFELRFSPVLQAWIYGINHVAIEQRYGGYRPQVFLATGLELGMWMANATFLCFTLRFFGTIREIRGFGIKGLFYTLLVTTIVCKSTGAIALMLAGIATLWASRRFGKSLAIWMLIVVAPVYTVSRAFDLWTGREVVELAKATVGDDRAESFQYRLDMERVLADHALERPILGWGRFNRSQVTNAEGKTTTVPDGFWIIELGLQGMLGLSCLLAVFLMPMILTLRRFPVATWRDPRVGPVVGLSMVVLLTMIDFLSNAMLNPIYPLVIGGLLGHSAYRLPVQGHVEAEEAITLASEFAVEGHIVEAGEEFRRAIELTYAGEDVGARTIRADAMDGLGHSLMAAGRLEESVAAFGEALTLRDELAAEAPVDDRFRDLAIAREGLSRALAEAGRVDEAVEERQMALRIWEALADNSPKDAEYREHRVDTLNDLAWLLATDPDLALRDPGRALALAEEAIRIAPDHDASWNTLGVARYRAGDWAGAIEALERSALSVPGEAGTAFDHYFLAMAWSQLHREDQAEEWLERGTAWVAKHRPGHSPLDRFRREAESLLRAESNGDGVPT